MLSAIAKCGCVFTAGGGHVERQLEPVAGAVSGRREERVRRQHRHGAAAAARHGGGGRVTRVGDERGVAELRGRARRRRRPWRGRRGPGALAACGRPGNLL